MVAFGKGKFDLRTVTETKLEESVEDDWCSL